MVIVSEILIENVSMNIEPKSQAKKGRKIKIIHYQTFSCFVS